MRAGLLEIRQRRARLHRGVGQGPRKYLSQDDADNIGRTTKRVTKLEFNRSLRVFLSPGVMIHRVSRGVIVLSYGRRSIIALVSIART